MDLISKYIHDIKASDLLGPQICHHREIRAVRAQYAEPARPWSGEVSAVLDCLGIARLYSHQVRAIDLVREGRHVVAATPTASGKSLIYVLPVLESAAADPEARALYLSPLKALAQDQLKTITGLTAPMSGRPGFTAAVYDGDTSQYMRTKLRKNPPNLVLSNPEMLHLSMLPHHRAWSALWSSLKYVIVDEVHTYRGVMGSHMAWVFRRLSRLCEHYGARPSFVFCSATIGNPGDLCSRLTGLEVDEVTKSGAPAGKKHVVFVNPLDGAARAAIAMLRQALEQGLKTIVFTQSRKLTELIAVWAAERSGPFRDKISAYRAGFLPEERREIEARMASGELLAVISTSALELGIDIGGLDLCLLVGYPGTVMSTWQRGGRVGRSMRESAVVMIAGEDALDQYFMRNPGDFFEREPEAAVINPDNPVILDRHLVCAAAELPLRQGERFLEPDAIRARVRTLELSGDLLRSADGRDIYSRRKAPHRDVDLRGSGSTFHILQSDTGDNIGQIDGFRAYKETHPGAIYLHRGQTYLVDDLDLGALLVMARPVKVNYYTRPRSEKDTEILTVYESRAVFGTVAHFGRLRITEQVTGYERRRVYGGNIINIVPLDLPPLEFETEGLWLEIPRRVQDEVEDERLHFMGGIHAVEHAAIGILPLLVLADRNDLGGISTPMHPQTGGPAVFVYDGAPGGVGLSRQAFSRAEDLIGRTRAIIATCPCELGCPSCVHSPKCGSGNRPIDKAAALYILNRIKSLPRAQNIKATNAQQRSNTATNSEVEPAVEIENNARVLPDQTPEHAPQIRFAVLDVETKRSAAEVGGWHKCHEMGVSCAVLFDSKTGRFHDYTEDELHDLFSRLPEFDLVVGFNIRRFDYRVLSAYSDRVLNDLPTLDLLDHVHARLGYRLSLDHLARATLGKNKTADGLTALKWYKQGLIQQIIDYCREDVTITRDLYLFGREHKHLVFTNKAKKPVRVPVDW